MKQSIVLPCFHKPQQDLGRFLDQIREIGYTAVELWSYDDSLEFVVATCAQHGIDIVSMVGHNHHCDRLGSHAEGFSRKENHERLEQELRHSIDLAVEFGIRGLITLSGHRNRGESDHASLLVCAEGLKRITPYAEEKGVNLNMELLNSTDHPHYLCDATDWAVNLCELVDSPNCKILYDIYHMQIMEGNVIRAIQRASKWIGHYHTAGVPGRRDLDEEQELNYKAICNAIRATEFEGYIGHEYSPKGDAIESLKHAFSVCSA